MQDYLGAHAARAEARAAETPSSEFWAIYDPDLGYRLNPKFGEFNADGLRDRAVSPKAGRFRILFLGDSIAQYGDTIDDTFVGHMRQALGGRDEFRHVDIVNAGVRGYTNYQELVYLRKYGVALEPDAVGVQFALNDLPRFLHSFEVRNGRIENGTYFYATDRVAEAPPRPLAKRIVDASHLLRWMRRNFTTVSRLLAWQLDQGFAFDHRIDLSSAWQDEPWSAIERQLAEADALGRARGFRLFVVMMPISHQYDEDYLSRDRAHVLKPQRVLKEICERLGIPFYDLYPDLHAGLFLEDGLHLTQEGRQRVGRRLATLIAEGRLVPASELRGPGADRTSGRAIPERGKIQDVTSLTRGGAVR